MTFRRLQNWRGISICYSKQDQTRRKKGAKLDNETKESAAQMIIDAGMRMKMKIAIADGDNDDLGEANNMPPSAPSPASGGRGKDLGPRKTPKRKRDEMEEKESFQESLLADLGSTKKFLQDFLTQTAEQDRKAAVEKKELMEKFILEMDNRHSVSDIKRCLSLAASLLIKKDAVLNDMQVLGITSALCGTDSFISAATSAGKATVFKGTLVLFDLLYNGFGKTRVPAHAKTKFVVIVTSPLVGLMEEMREEDKKEAAADATNQESQKLIAMATLAMSKMMAVLDKKGLLDA